ncbi:diadenylate cyclase [Erysipelotrichaceae bacterium]|nr:diadenylate cyclase [Erysipelotrichaceae bacterium]
MALNNLMALITTDNIILVLGYILDLLLVWFFLYFVIRIMRFNIRMIQILKGVVILTIVKLLSGWLNLVTINWLVGLIIDWGAILVVIIFQPEIRSGLENLGRKSAFIRKSLTIDEREMLIREISTAADYLSKRHIGALITIEKTVLMNDFVAQGMRIDSEISFQLLTTIFTPNSTLHDGAVIIQGTKIACASALFPATARIDIPPEMGTRHRAALGISEITDSITVVVSEETGTISLAEKGRLYSDLQKESLVEILKEKLLKIDSEDMNTRGENEDE